MCFVGKEIEAQMSAMLCDAPDAGVTWIGELEPGLLSFVILRSRIGLFRAHSIVYKILGWSVRG